ncbi:hypothetical protein BH09BAC6_BH09BAC6_19190 [soil metagenome]
MKHYKELIAIGVIAAAVIIGSCKTHFETTKVNYTATASELSFNRGRNLVNNICSGCHYDKSSGKFIGTLMHDVPSIMGKVYSANLTASKTHGIPPRYTDAQLKYLLKTGIAKDGRFIPYMLRPNLAESDLDAIVVYLRSGDGPVAAADTTIGLTNYTGIRKMLVRIKSEPLPYREGVKRPVESDEVANGRYLVDNIGCYHCHSKSLTSMNYLNPEQTPDYMGGGLKFKTPTGESIYASNLTADKQTGIGNYTKMDFRKAVQHGEAPTRKLHPPMPQFHALTNEQADAIYAYLQTLPAMVHKIQGQ